MKYRNMFVQVLLMIVTFGLYGVYWYYAVSQEMAAYLKREEPVFLWTILFCVPILFLYSYYKQGELFERVCPDMNRWIIFALWILFPPAVWIIIQPKLNKISNQADL